jgi:hypothetical protein
MTHGGLNRALHGAAEGNTALQLLSDEVGNQLGVDFRLAHFNDVQMHFGVGDLANLPGAASRCRRTFLPMTTPGRPE